MEATKTTTISELRKKMCGSNLAIERPRSNATKLSKEDYENIRKMFIQGIYAEKIKKKYHIGTSRLIKIVTNKYYVPGGEYKSKI